MAGRLRWPSTLRWRLTLWYTVLLGVPLVAVAIGCYVLFERTLAARTDAFIGDALTAVSRELVAERRAAAGAMPAIRSTVAEVRFRDLHVAVLDDAGASVASTADEGAGPTLDARIAATRPRGGFVEPAALTVHAPVGDYRVLARPALVGAERFELVGAYPLAETEAMLARIRRVFIVLVPLLVACAATGGWFLATRGLAPVSAMAERAAEISATNLRERLPVGGGEELARLAVVVNDLLERLEASFGQQRRFMADASHELRTPTAIIRTEADVTLAQAHRPEAEYRASMGVVQDAVRRLTRIVDDLFLLARADPGAVSTRHAEVYLEELVHDATRAVNALAESRGVRVEVREVAEAPFVGDADLLGRLLLNLLDNAIKHSPAGAVVTIALTRVDGRYEIDVVDAGPGIPASDRERIFERFVRLGGDGVATIERERRAMSGAGLGLAISRRIAEAHGGTLELLESRPGRTTFRVSLPATAAPSPQPVG